MPTGRIKFFDQEKQFGFITGDDGQRVYVHASTLPADHPNPRPGTRVEYGVAEGRRGPQAISVEVLQTPELRQKWQRRKAEEMVTVVEDLIQLLDGASDSLRRGNYPENSRQIAKVLNVVAEDFSA